MNKTMSFTTLLNVNEMLKFTSIDQLSEYHRSKNLFTNDSLIWAKLNDGWSMIITDLSPSEFDKFREEILPKLPIFSGYDVEFINSLRGILYRKKQEETESNKDELSRYLIEGDDIVIGSNVGYNSKEEAIDYVKEYLKEEQPGNIYSIYKLTKVASVKAKEAYEIKDLETEEAKPNGATPSQPVGGGSIQTEAVAASPVRNWW